MMCRSLFRDGCLWSPIWRKILQMYQWESVRCINIKSLLFHFWSITCKEIWYVLRWNLATEKSEFYFFHNLSNFFDNHLDFRFLISVITLCFTFILSQFLTLHFETERETKIVLSWCVEFDFQKNITGLQNWFSIRMYNQWRKRTIMCCQYAKFIGTVKY